MNIVIRVSGFEETCGDVDLMIPSNRVQKFHDVWKVPMKTFVKNSTNKYLASNFSTLKQLSFPLLFLEIER